MRYPIKRVTTKGIVVTIEDNGRIFDLEVPHSIRDIRDNAEVKSGINVTLYVKDGKINGWRVFKPMPKQKFVGTLLQIIKKQLSGNRVLFLYEVEHEGKKLVIDTKNITVDDPVGPNDRVEVVCSRNPHERHGTYYAFVFRAAHEGNHALTEAEIEATESAPADDVAA